MRVVNNSFILIIEQERLTINELLIQLQILGNKNTPTESERQFLKFWTEITEL